MKLTIEQPTLLHALTKVASVIEQRNTVPILAHVALYADDVLTVCGTDLDLEVTTKADATITDQGSTTVSAIMLLNIVKKLAKGAMITLETTSDRLKIKSGKSNFDLATLPVNDFPSFKDEGYTSSFELSVADINSLFGKTAFAMSTDETRYYLNGVYLHNIGGVATAVTTDGHRLAKVTGTNVGEFAGVIVPRKTVGVVNGAADIGTAIVSVCDTKIRFDFGETVIASKVIEGTFPDYTRVIPDNQPNRATVDCSEFSRAADRVTSVSEDKERAIKLEFNEGKIVLSVAGSLNSAVDEVDATLIGDVVSVGMSSKYLHDTLRQISGDVDVGFSGPMDPLKLSPRDDDSAVFVIMPRRV